MVLCEKEFCPSVVLALMCLHDLLCPLRVLLFAGAKILFDLSISPCLYGFFTGQEYSKSHQTIEKYAISYNFGGHSFKFLLKKPSVELALLAILEM